MNSAVCAVGNKQTVSMINGFPALSRSPFSHTFTFTLPEHEYLTQLWAKKQQNHSHRYFLLYRFPSFFLLLPYSNDPAAFHFCIHNAEEAKRTQLGGNGWKSSISHTNGLDLCEKLRHAGSATLHYRCGAGRAVVWKLGGDISVNYALV